MSIYDSTGSDYGNYTDITWKPEGQSLFGDSGTSSSYGGSGHGYFGNGGENLLNKDYNNAWNDFSKSSGNWGGGGSSGNWGDTGWGKGIIGASKFLSSYLDKNSHNLNYNSDPYGRGNTAWGSPANVASSWSQLGSTFKDLGEGNSVETYPTSHQIGYIPGTPGSRGWGSTAIGIAGSLASLAFPGAAAVIGPATGALSGAAGAFNV